MIYLLDTDALIDLIRGLKASSRQKARERALAVLQHCQQSQKEGHLVGVSAITTSELEFGAQRSGRYPEESRAIQKILAPFEIYDYIALECSPHYGRIRHLLEKDTCPIGSMDLLIASHALGLNATLVTSNLRHFSRVPDLRLKDWRPPDSCATNVSSNLDG